MTPEEHLAIQMARIEERVKIVMDELQEAAASRKEQYKAMEMMNLGMQALGQRVGTMEETISKNAPALAEYVATKNKIIGAGVLGRWIWFAAGGLLGLITSGKGIASWLSKLGG
jgi:tetrahydromethanopterin S-methyltransferase subunit B